MFSTYSQHFISVPFNYQSMSFERVQKHKNQGAYVLLKNNNKKCILFLGNLIFTKWVRFDHTFMILQLLNPKRVHE